MIVAGGVLIGRCDYFVNLVFKWVYVVVVLLLVIILLVILLFMTKLLFRTVTKQLIAFHYGIKD